MMTQDIRTKKLKSQFFAQLVSEEIPIPPLEDGIMYVLTTGRPEWTTAAKQARGKAPNYPLGGYWLMDYAVQSLPDDFHAPYSTQVVPLMAEGFNLVMPLSTPGQEVKFYLVGKVEKPQDVEPAFALFTTDAEDLTDTCLMLTLRQLGSDDFDRLADKVLEELTDDEDDTPCFQDICFRGKAAAPSFAGISTVGFIVPPSEEPQKPQKDKHKERQALLKNIGQTIRKMKCDDPAVQEQGELEFSRFYNTLSEHEKQVLLRQLLLIPTTVRSKKEVHSVADRDMLGKQSRFCIVLLERTADSRLRDDQHYGLYLRDEKEQLTQLPMGRLPAVVYTMSLIERKTRNKPDAIVKLHDNKKAFCQVYRLLFDTNVQEAERTFTDTLLSRQKRDADKHVVEKRAGRLPECYKGIEDCLHATFKKLGENYSPFLANATTPLAIPPEKISLPDMLTKVKIH